jgi:NitT/TauT family transport system substrate-binding protein
MSMRHYFVASLAFALSVVAPAFAQQPIKLNVGITNSASDVCLFVADAKGYFKREGLEVNFVKFDSAARMIAPFASGDLDIGAGGPSAGLFNAVARGIDIRIVADKTSTVPGRPINFLIVRKDLVDSGRYKQLSDLRGMKIGGAAPGGAATATLYKLLVMAGLRTSDVERVYMGFPQQVIAVQNKAIDAAMPTEPFVTDSIVNGSAARILGDDVIYPGHQLATLFYTGPFVQKNPDAAKRFMRAYIMGARDYNDAIVGTHLSGSKGEEMIDILTRYSLVTDPAIHRSLTAVNIDPDGKVNAASLREDIDIFAREGLLEGKVDMEKVIDTSIAEAVVKEIGPYARKP